MRYTMTSTRYARYLAANLLNSLCYPNKAIMSCGWRMNWIGLLLILAAHTFLSSKADSSPSARATLLTHSEREP